MKKTMVIILAMVLLTSLTLSVWVVGAQEQKKEEVVLKVVGRTWSKAHVEWAGQKLNDNHPELDITLDYALYEYAECRSQLAIRLSRSEPIDVMILDHIWLGEFKDLIQQFDPKDVPNYDEWVPSFRKLMEKYADKGKTSGLYYSTDVRMMFWNKELMKKCGIEDVKIETWDDVKKYAQMIKDKENLLPAGVKPVGFMAGGSEHTNSRWYSLLWAAGGDILSADETKAAFNQEPGVKALEFYGWFLKNGMVSPEDVLSPKDGAVYDESFINGKFVLSLGNGDWLGSSTIKNLGMSKEDFLEKFDTTLIPAPKGGVRGTSVAGGYLWSLSKFAKHPELAKEYIYYICGPEGWNLYEVTGKRGLPTVSSALPTIDDRAYSEVIKDAMTMVRFRPTIPEYSKIAAVIRNAIQNYVQNYDRVTAKEILDDAAEKVNNILKK